VRAVSAVAVATRSSQRKRRSIKASAANELQARASATALFIQAAFIRQTRHSKNKTTAQPWLSGRSMSRRNRAPFVQQKNALQIL
jgi:hypothetical protein